MVNRLERLAAYVFIARDLDGDELAQEGAEGLGIPTSDPHRYSASPRMLKASMIARRTRRLQRSVNASSTANAT
jgi:hypothetical protein